MSKINQMQLAALKAPASPIDKSTTKSTLAKSTSTKALESKSSKSKPTAKPIMDKTKSTANKTKVYVKESKVKTRKAKMERDSFTMPKEEYAQISILKARSLALGKPAKKSELLRAGIKLLAAMTDNTLKATLAAIPVIKTGRPNKN